MKNFRARRSRVVFGLTSITLALSAAVACSTPVLTDGVDSTEQAVGETHPFQSRLVCERAQGNVLVGVLFDIASGSKVKVTEFQSAGNVGACELAVRAARNNKVCVPSGGGFTLRNLTTGTNQGSYGTLAACTTVSRGSPTMRTDPGFVDFIAPAEIAPFVAKLPNVPDATIDQALKNPKTMWYDESALTFVYQDSFGNPKGLRANRVGYDVGITSKSVPDIFALTEYFQPQGFKFPFTFSAGATFTENVYVLDFWLPPTGANGAAKPVRIWKNNSHWQWVFPVGTVIGEVLFIQATDDKQWFPFEIRSRVRGLNGWSTGVFRPYVQATDLAQAIKEKRPAWNGPGDLQALVTHLESTETLTPHTMTAPSYAKLFPPLQGAMDYLPATADLALVKELLGTKTWSNAMGARWKTNAAGTMKTFAASTHAAFHVVPREYPGGMLETTEAACRACHVETSRPLNNLDSRVVLYGEVWGEDEIFTWHPFLVDEDTFSVADGNRNVNPRLVTSGLVEMATPASAPQTYKVLPKPYAAVYE